MQGSLESAPGRRARLAMWTERLLVMAGAATLTWCALSIADAHFAQQRARRSLATLAGPTIETPAKPRLIVARGAPLAELSMPRLQLSAVVLHGSDAQTLRRGLGHIENTPLPGESGNVAIAGHRDSFFRQLRNVQLGDDVFLDTPQGRLRYRVSSFRVVKSNDVSVLNATKDATLTLVTCYPFWVLGNAPDRFVVRATRTIGAWQGTASTERTQPAGVGVDRARASRAAEEQRNDSPTPVNSISSGARDLRAPTVRAVDDDRLVRQTIERFRRTYNARLTSHGQLHSDELTFQTCSTTVEAEKATATCYIDSAPGDTLESAAWTFDLRQLAGVGWSIRSIAME